MISKRLILALFVVLGLFIAPANAQPDEVLDLHRTTFNTSKYFDVFHNTGINATTELLELGSVPVLVIEDFVADWTETDGYGAITVHNSTAATYDGNFRGAVQTTLWRNMKKYVDFEYIWKQNVDDIELNTRTSDGVVMSIQNNSQSFQWNKLTNNEGAFIIQRTESGVDTEYKFVLFILENGVNLGLGTSDALNIDQNYWIRWNRTGFLMSLAAYSDAAMTIKVTQINGDTSANWANNYAFAKMTVLTNLGVATNADNDMTMFDLALGNTTGGYHPIGETFTSNLLANTTLNAFSLILNSSTPLGGNIHVLASNDNASWVSLGNVTNIVVDWSYFVLESLNWNNLYINLILTLGDVDTPQIYDFWFEHEPVGGAVNITQVAGSWVDYNASLIWVNVGTYVSGNLVSLEFVDGDFYRVNEVVGVPGFDVRLNYTGLNTSLISLSSRIMCQYEGNPAHDIDIEAWNFRDSVWDIINHVPEHPMQWNNASLSLRNDHINGTGSVWIRIIHKTGGANGHYLWINYARMRAFIPTGGGVVGVATSSFMWLTLFFIMAFAGAIAFKRVKK